jgi:hypothetical protein
MSYPSEHNYFSGRNNLFQEKISMHGFIHLVKTRLPSKKENNLMQIYHDFDIFILLHVGMYFL